MKKLSIRLKMTLWFAIVAVIVVAITYGIFLSISNSVMQKTIQDNLVETVEANVDEIEYFSSAKDGQDDHDGDQYIVFGDGVLEIDDDFLNQVNGISTALYQEDNFLLYGENPIAKASLDTKFADVQLQKKTVDSITWYMFDRKLTGVGLEGLWLRGIVSSEQGTQQLSTIRHMSIILMPIVLAIGILGGYLIAGRTLRPIKQITKMASQIGHGRDLKKRIDLGQGKDEVHQLASTFDEMFDRLDNAFESERQFTADASHELRTPMSVIMAQCEFILEKDRSPEEYQEALRLIGRQGSKMTGLIADMLTFTRLDRKTESFTKEQIAFSELCTMVCEDMALLRDKNITLQYHIQPQVSMVGNQDLLIRLLTNLISNAYRYGKDNGHIIVTLEETNNRVKLMVEDDGIGIKPEECDKIFERFYQVDQSRTNIGTGLGLAMVREIAELHGGSMSVESEVGKGSKFIFLK